MRRRGTGLSGVAALLLLWPVALAGQEGALEGLDSYVEAAMREAKVPGLALAIVQDGTLLTARGYGTRERERPERVDGRTLFAIGSMTKSFTAAALALLEKEGRIRWDDQVTRHLPEFRVSDPWVTRELTLLDLLTHRSGLERADLLWYTLDHGPDSLQARMAHLEQADGFRAGYAYNNLGYFVVGRVVEVVSGRPWGEFVTDRILSPLGMSRTVTTVEAAAALPNVASHHIPEADSSRAISSRDYPAAPAGGILASARDMARWLLFQMSEGRSVGGRLLSPESTHRMHVPRVVVPERGTGPGPRTRFPTYALGWNVAEYRGERLVGHGGAVDGMRGQMLFLPDRDLGVVVLGNLRGSGIATAVAYRIVDAFLGAEERDWAARILDRDRTRAAAQRREDREEAESRASGTRPSLSLEAYAGTYEDPLWGGLAVTRSDGTLHARFGRLRGELEHWHFDVFRVVWDDPVLDRSFLTFRMDRRGLITEAELEGVGTLRRRQRQR